MCPLTFSALLGLAAGCPPPGPSNLLAPADPAFHDHWAPPPSPTADSKFYRPVEANARGWLGSGAPQGRAMPEMPGISGHGR